MDRTHGFSLIEVMAVVAIAAIVAALAAQSYSRYAMRSRRAQAQHTLMAIAQAQERWYATYNRYADNLDKLGYAGPAPPPGDYDVAMSVLDDDAQRFVAVAAPIGRQADDVCGHLSIDHAGQKLPGREDAVANANGSCW